MNSDTALSGLELEFREIVFSNDTVYEIINRQIGPRLSSLFTLVKTGNHAMIADKASTNILHSMLEVYQ